MARPRRIKSPKEMLELWERFKGECDHQKVLVHEFSVKNSEFVSAELEKSITYTIEGFCVFANIPRSVFYDTYAADERFSDIVTCMKEECEVDARRKFETGRIPTQLAGLWMSKYGYTTRQETDATVNTSPKLEDVFAQLGGKGLSDGD